MAFVVHPDSSTAQPQASINITPLVDVMLVLLVIFMVAVPLVSQVLPMGLSGGPPDQAPATQVTLHLKGSGGASLDDRSIDEARLAAELHWLAAGDRQPSLIFRVDPEVQHQRLASSLTAARASGFSQIAFAPGGN